MYAVEARSLVKRFVSYARLGFFKRRRIIVNALRGVSLNVKWGEVYGLLGPNGAGKTTTVKILSTLLIPDEGEAYVDGHNVVDEANRVKPIIGLLLYPDRGFYSRLSGLENLTYFGRLYGLSSVEAYRRAIELLKLVDLEWAKDRPYEEYSLGMKARLALARALINDPLVVFLDEPTIGLDPISSRIVRGIVRDLAKQGKAIIMTSHNLWEVERVCDRVGFIKDGRIVLEGSPSEVKARLGLRYVVEVEYEHMGNVELGRFEVDDPVQGVKRILNEMESSNIRVTSIRIHEPSLEDAYVKVIKGG